MHRNPLKFRYFGVILISLSLFSKALAAEITAISGTTHFKAAEGFKPAQRNFQNIFLQLAGSLEHHGSPEPWLRHVHAEASRIEAAYIKTKGKRASILPDYFTAEYLDALIKGWNQMAPTLGLENFSRAAGRSMRWAMMGSWNMTPDEMAAQEPSLNSKESAEFRRLISKPYFTKGDFQALEDFYADGGGYDKLSDRSKAAMSKRVERGTMPPDKRTADIDKDRGGTLILTILREHQSKSIAYFENPETGVANADSLQQLLVQRLRLSENGIQINSLPESERDALAYSHAIKTDIVGRLGQVKKQVSPELANKVDKGIFLMLENILAIAQAEYEAGLYAEILSRNN